MPSISYLWGNVWVGRGIIVLGVIALILGLRLLVQKFEQMVLFPAPSLAGNPPPGLPPDARLELLKTADGEIESVFLPAHGDKDSARPTIIYCHGNGEVIDFHYSGFENFRQAGYHVLLVEYPGYGRSAGVPSEQSIERTVVAAYDRLTTLPEVDSTKLIGYGRSMGGGAICLLAKQRPLAAVILESTYTSIPDVAASRFGLASHLVRNIFDNRSVVATLSIPVLILHGTQDGVVPCFCAEQLHAACPGSTLITEDCGHNDFRSAQARSLLFLQNFGLASLPLLIPESSATRVP